MQKLTLLRSVAEWAVRGLNVGGSKILSSCGKLKFTGRGSGERSKQTRGTGYEASACFRALDVGEKCQSQIRRPLEHKEQA